MASLLPGTNRQVPDHSIMDAFNKQTYLSNQFVYAVDQQIGSTNETPLLYLSNPAVTASAFPSGFQSLFVNLYKLNCLTASQSAILRVYLNPTSISGGTSETPINLRPFSQNLVTSVGALTLTPSDASNGTLIDVLSALPGEPDESTMLSILDPGNSILITAQTTSTSTFIGVKLGWFQL